MPRNLKFFEHAKLPNSVVDVLKRCCIISNTSFMSDAM